MQSKIDSIFIRHDNEKICQGDIFRDYTLPIWVEREDKEIKVQNLKIPYFVVLTQECDLDEDYKNHKPQEIEKPEDKHDKYLQSILVCPIYHAEKLREGTHLAELKLKMERYNRDRWNLIKTNQNFRFHYIKGEQELQIPESVIDFKHYYTVPRSVIYSNYRDHYLATINELFRELLSQRFANYLSRIGVPNLIDQGSSCDTE